MLTKIGPNKQILSLKLAGLVILLGMSLFFVLANICPSGIQLDNTHSGPPLFFAIFPLLLAIEFVINIVSMPIAVSFASQITTNNIEIRFFPFRSKTIIVSDIASYAPVTICTRLSNYNGILIQVQNKKIILLSNYNLKDYSPLLSFRDNAGVPKKEPEKFNFFSYHMQALRRN